MNMQKSWLLFLFSWLLFLFTVAIGSLIPSQQSAFAEPTQWTIDSDGNGHWYEAVSASGGISWQAAKAMAEQRGGYLAIISSDGENNFVFQLVNQQEKFWVRDSCGYSNNGPWLGGFEAAQGTWAWISGEPFVFSKWWPGQPDNRFAGEDCLHYFTSFERSPEPFWNDAVCGGFVAYPGACRTGGVNGPLGFLVEYDTYYPGVPGKPTTITPSGAITTNQPTYSWNAVSTASWYQLWVNDSTGNKIATWHTAAQTNCASGTGTCSITPAVILATGNATWWVRGWNSAGYGPWSDPRAFSVLTGGGVPGKPTTITPSGAITTNQPTYSWNAVSTASWYQLWVNDSTGNKIATWHTAAQTNCASGTGTCSITPAVILATGNATWWVRGWNSAGYGPWSDPRAFSVLTGGGVPGKPTTITPSGAITTNQPTYSWNAVSTASWYQLWVNDSTGNKIATWHTAAQTNCASGTGTCSITPAVILATGNATWWVRGWNSAGYGPWSDLRAFSVLTALFNDNFDSYSAGSFPSGWTLRTSGSGSSNQYVDTARFTSTPKSLRLQGSYCWSANAYHPVNSPANPASSITLTAKVFINQIVSGGCTNITAWVGLLNPSIGTWGTAYGAISFAGDGFIYASQKEVDKPDVKLIAYNAQTWYIVKTQVDLVAKTFDVYINGTLQAQGLKILVAGLPTGVEVSAGHGNSPTAWFDDISVDITPDSD